MFSFRLKSPLLIPDILLVAQVKCYDYPVVLCVSSLIHVYQSLSFSVSNNGLLQSSTI